MRDHIAGLGCHRCQRSARAGAERCPDCPDGGTLRYHYAPQTLSRAQWARREPWLWRYRELLPFDPDEVEPPPLHVGMTPLYGSPRLAAWAGVAGLLVKDESRQPTGRIHDRAAALLVAQAKLQSRVLVAGDLALPAAAFAAAADVPVVGLTDDAGRAAQLQSLGAHAVQLDPLLDLSEAVQQAAQAGLLAGGRPHPLAFEGLKTLGLELGELLGERPPDWVVVDEAEPDLVEATLAAFAQLQSGGLLERPPRVLGVSGEAGAGEAAQQLARALGLLLPAEGCAALAGLKRAVAAGQIDPGSVALVVVQGAAPAAGPVALRHVEVVRNWNSLRTAVRAGASALQPGAF